MNTLSLIEWVQLLSSLGTLIGGSGIFGYVLRNEKRMTIVETSLDIHLKNHD